MNWRCGSSGGVPDFQVQNPECKPESYKKNPPKNQKNKEMHLTDKHWLRVKDEKDLSSKWTQTVRSYTYI
jgi:hypothetical protein